MQKIKHLLGFTLVELIVVITIVGILSTVGFVSYSGYLSGARDSNRISQLTKLSDSLQVYSASKSLPLPDDYIEIQASGSLIAYQGYVGVDVLETIDYTNGGTDPKDDTYYTYYLTRDRKSLQLMAMMEEQSSTAFHLSKSTNAINYEERYPKVYGKKLGVLTYSDDSNRELLNTPAQEITANAGGIDIINTTASYNAHLSENISVSGSGKVLSSLELLNKYGSKFIRLNNDGGIVFTAKGSWNYDRENEKCVEIELFSEENLSIIEEAFQKGFTNYEVDTDLEFYYRGDDSSPQHYVYGKNLNDFSDYNLHLNFGAGDNTVMTLLSNNQDTIRCTTSNSGRCGTNGLPVSDSNPILLYRVNLQPTCSGATAHLDNWARNHYTFQGKYYSLILKK